MYKTKLYLLFAFRYYLMQKFNAFFIICTQLTVAVKEYRAFCEIKIVIENLCADDIILDTEFTLRGHVENIFFFCVDILSEAIRELNQPNNASQVTVGNEATCANVKLPKSDIPVFLATIVNGHRFRITFLSWSTKTNLWRMSKSCIT